VDAADDCMGQGPVLNMYRHAGGMAIDLQHAVPAWKNCTCQDNIKYCKDQLYENADQKEETKDDKNSTVLCQEFEGCCRLS